MNFFMQHLAASSTSHSSSEAAALARIPPFFFAGGSGPSHKADNASTDLFEELWQACAGSLVYVPRENERVWYFPQGHMEQVAASTQQKSCKQLPNSGLTSQILCRVVSRVLSAEADNDEVYAQISLLPELPGSLDMIENNNQEDSTTPQPRSSTRLFIKILTASDTSTHGGFSVLRKHAEECLPPLDMSQDPPTQNLVAKDLHGHEWSFRHTYRGHPRRHLLTTGWSVFVSQKKLLAGDAVIFLRGENNELRVGIRRAKRQQTAPQAVMSSQSMHMGVVATASHALGTRTMFTVFFKPRMSLSAFLVPLEKFSKALSVSLSVGMRFKMHFETEDASDRSFTGTITEIEDMDGSNWANSKWRSLKVNWDESNNERPERVSPWEIELCTSSPVVSPPLPPVRSKRQRPSHTTSTFITDFSGPGYSSIVLQGQEPLDMGINSFWRSPRNSNSLMQDTPHLHHHVHVQQPHQQLEGASGSSSVQFSNNRTAFYAPYASPREVEQNSSVASSSIYSDIGYSLNHRHSWPASSDDIPPSWRISSQPPWASSSREESVLATSHTLPPPLVQQQTPAHLPSLFSNIPSFPLGNSREQDTSVTVPAISTLPSPPPVVGDSGVRLFGISLTDKPNIKSPKDPDVPGFSSEGETFRHEQQQPHAQDSETPVKSEAIFEQEKLDYSMVDPRSTHSTRSCVKVIKKGSMVGRGIDLTRFEGYDSLLEELESMFNMKGELTNPEKGWQVAYSDREGDTMKVGDDPWPEFCGMVKKLYILSPEEMCGAG
uniref:Auxin response factor n=1 Tax=Cyrtomium guizhouense TaxID=306076 RepID=A0A1X9T683_9MONI|nr:auxin response factor 2 [Cyrtomium guizhouense]